MRPDATELKALLAAGGVKAEPEDVFLGAVARVRPREVIDALASLNSAGYESLVDFFGTDTGEAVELTWHVRSYSRDAEVDIKTTVHYDAEIDSVWNVYPSALMPERETAELLGLKLGGHPNPRRLLTPDGAPPFLRRSVPIRTPAEAERR